MFRKESNLKADCYVYVHKKATNGEVFYIGKGRGNRITSRSGRSNYWRNIVRKHGVIFEKVAENMTDDDAYALEIQMIASFRENGKKICNIANGGEGGLSGIKLKNCHKEKLRKAKLGKKQMPEHAKKSASAKIGKKQPREAVEKTREAKSKKVINSDGEIFRSASDAARIIGQRLGCTASQGNISMAARGERNEAYGYSWSYDTSSTPDAPSGITASMKRIKCSNGMKFNSTMDATRWVKSWRGKSSNQTITACARGITNTAYGFKWWYIA